MMQGDTQVRSHTGVIQGDTGVIQGDTGGYGPPPAPAHPHAPLDDAREHLALALADVTVAQARSREHPGASQARMLEQHAWDALARAQQAFAAALDHHDRGLCA